VGSPAHAMNVPSQDVSRHVQRKLYSLCSADGDFNSNNPNCQNEGRLRFSFVWRFLEAHVHVLQNESVSFSCIIVGGKILW
jgi:hypothetical protein